MDVYGLSLDDVAAMAMFAKREELNFQLLSDPDGSAAAKFDVLPAKARFTKRVTFVIDDKGVLRHVDEAVKVKHHGEDLVALLRKLQG